MLEQQTGQRPILDLVVPLSRGDLMTLPAFKLLKPQTLVEALELLAKESGAFPIAGGTNLMVDIRAGKLTLETVIDLSGLDELRGIESTDTEITIRRSCNRRRATR